MKRNVREEMLSKVWFGVESLYEDLAKSEAISFDEYCFLLIEGVKKKQKPSQVVINNGLLPVLNPVVLSFLDLESILSGSVFMVCKDWHNQLINSELLWKSIFTRLSQSIVEFSNSFEGWPIQQQLHNEHYSTSSRHLHMRSKVSVMFPKLDTWQAQKEYCLTKYCSYRKSVKLGNVKSYLCTTHNYTTYLHISTTIPSLYAPFHITANSFSVPHYNTDPHSSENNEILYISSSSGSGARKEHSFINISLDYFSTTNFTMNIKVDNTTDSFEPPTFNMDINVKQLNSSNDSDCMQLFKIDFSDKIGAGDEEQDEEDENVLVLRGSYRKNISTFRREWIGESGKIPYRWLINFLANLDIPALSDVFYHSLDHIENI